MKPKKQQQRQQQPSQSQSSTNTNATTSSNGTSSTYTRNKHKSSPGTIESKLLKANQLEQKLTKSSSNDNVKSTSTTNNNNEILNNIRINLCEIYSDLILSNPSYAYKQDICNKLWRNCFYVRINELRLRISKDKSKLNKLKVSNKNNAIHHEMNKNDDQYIQQEKVKDQLEKRCNVLQKALDIFLKEAIVLYEYLIDQLHGMLLDYVEEGDCSNTDTATSSRIIRYDEYDRSLIREIDDDHGDDEDNKEMDHQTTTTKSKKSSSKIIHVVPTLFRIYIHLGDLFRYSNKYDSAEKVYLSASQLAPGKGNPYNQLAVCAQINDAAANSISAGASAGGGSNPLPAVALYWYCRSLLASHEAFITSKSNLERLFMSNKKWIEERNIQSFADIAKKNIVTTTTEGSEKNKENQRVTKSNAKRKFLSLFVNFHGSLFSLMKERKEMNVKNGNKSSNMDGLIQEMNNLIVEFSSILDSSTFGDAFLIKMISINAFSLWNGLEYPNRRNEKESKEKRSGSTDVPLELLETTAIAMIFTLKFSMQLCSNLTIALEKAISKQQKQGKKTFGSIRLIGPLFMLCDFIANECNLSSYQQQLYDASSSLATIFDGSVKEFWSDIAKVANIIYGNEALMTLINSECDFDINELPDEFQSLVRGYTPFLSLNSASKNEAKMVYISPEEAVGMLELCQSQTQQSQLSQRSRKMASLSQNTNDKRTPEKIEIEFKIKLQRFMKFITKNLDSGALIKEVDGLIKAAHEHTDIIESKDSVDNVDYNMNIDEEQLDDVNMNESDEKNNENVLVYTAAESGKPALLVPGAMLLGNDVGEEKHREDDNDIVMNESSNVSDVTMTGGMDERHKSVPNLLDPSLLIDKEMSTTGDEIGESKLLAVMNKNTSASAPDLSVVPKNHVLERKPVVGPPPGFNLLQKPFDTPKQPPMPPGFQSLYPDLPNNLPPPQVHGHGQTPSYSLPQTANPFVTPMSHNTMNVGATLFNDNAYSRLAQSSEQTFNNDIYNQNQNPNEMNLDYDMFGLRSLGILSDDQNVPTDFSVDSLFQSHPIKDKKTQNPFAYDHINS